MQLKHGVNKVITAQDFKDWCDAIDQAVCLMSDETGRNIKDFSVWELMVWLTQKRLDAQGVRSC